MYSWCKRYVSKGAIYKNAQTLTLALQCVHPNSIKTSSKPNSSWNTLFFVISIYLVLILRSDHSLTACQVGGETSANREQLNKLLLCCQVLGRRKRHRGLEKELKPLLQTPRNPRGWGVRRKKERRAKVGRKAYRERKQRVKNKGDKVAEGDGKSERQSREYKNEGTEEAWYDFNGMFVDSAPWPGALG